MNILFWCSVVGAGMMLVAFMMKTWRDVARGTLLDEVLNFLGAALLTVYTVALHEWALVVLNVVWGAWSVKLIFDALRTSRR